MKNSIFIYIFKEEQTNLGNKSYFSLKNKKWQKCIDIFIFLDLFKIVIYFIKKNNFILLTILQNKKSFINVLIKYSKRRKKNNRKEKEIA